jgi:hypothetical protein
MDKSEFIMQMVRDLYNDAKGDREMTFEESNHLDMIETAVTDLASASQATSSHDQPKPDRPTGKAHRSFDA